MKTLSKTALLLSAAASAYGQSAWLPEAGQFLFSPYYSYQTFDEFWAGRDKVSTPGDDDVNQHTALLTIEYGLSPTFAADVTLGYTWVETTDAFPPATNASDDGMTDTTFGLRWGFLDENKVNCPIAPTLALRVGGIIEGTYDEGVPFSAGDGASGWQASILAGKAICPGFGFFGEIGYRDRNHNVPEDLFGSAGLYARYKGLTVNVAYRHVQGLRGEDIGDPGFTFPETKEITQNIEGGLGYVDSGGRYYQVFYAHTIDGRNTGEKDIFGVSFTIPFGGRR